MSDQILKFAPGKAIHFTSGEYSDFSSLCVLITLKDTDLPALAVEYRKSQAAADEFDWCDCDAFPAWLITQGYAMAADVETVHLGSYGTFRPELREPQ